MRLTSIVGTTHGEICLIVVLTSILLLVTGCVRDRVDLRGCWVNSYVVVGSVRLEMIKALIDR